MEISLIFVIVILIYFCVIFPLQMRRYMFRRRQLLQSQRPQTTNNPPYAPYTRTVTYQNTNISSEQTDHHLGFGVSNSPPPGYTEAQRDDDAIAAARHLEAEHRQQIIDIQREIEQQAIRRREDRDLNGQNFPPRTINNSSTVPDPVAEYSQQIIDIQREIEQQTIQREIEQSIRRQENRDMSGPHFPPRIISSSTPHIPSRLINSSTIRSSIYTITSGNATGVSNSSLNYPYAPPLTPDGDGVRRSPDRSNSKDDELPSYDQAVAFDSTTTSVTIRRY